VCDRELPEGVDWLDGLAIDGKTVRNSAAPGGGADVRLFSALLHREQVVINQIAVPDHTTEVTQVEDLLDPVDLSGKVVTGDAAHTQGDAAAEYVAGERNADYAITVKGNRDKLLGQIWARMPRPTAGSADYTHEQILGGRRIVREIWVRPGTGISFPRLKQVFRIRRQVFDLSGQRLSKEYVHGVTSLDSDQATPAQLLGLIRHHWRVEVNHQVRDVTWREDHQSRLHRQRRPGHGHDPQPGPGDPTAHRPPADHPHPTTDRRRPNPDPADPSQLPTPSHDQLTLQSGWCELPEPTASRLVQVSDFRTDRGRRPTGASPHPRAADQRKRTETTSLPQATQSWFRTLAVANRASFPNG
jgi:hypothetical protein